MALDRLARLISVASAIFLIAMVSFALGMFFHIYKPWPHAHVYAGIEATARAIRTGAFLPKNAVFAAPAGASREFVKVHGFDRQIGGYRAVMGFVGTGRTGYGIRLLDKQGRLIHAVAIDYGRIAPAGTTATNDDPHAMLLLPDGSAIVNFDHGAAMARFDKCGIPVWMQPGYFHHSLDQADDGSVWTWRGDGSSVAQYQYLSRLDPDSGRVLQEIGLIEDLVMKSPRIATALSVAPGYEPQRSTDGAQVEDLFHPNDVEVLRADMAPMFPSFTAGDLLISLRTSNLVAVVDPVQFRLKWVRYGPWIGQHDPDFAPDGTISVFNNNTDGSESSIVAVDPKTNISVALHAETNFYSAFMGKHSILPDGSIQVVVPGEGRVLEFARDGKLLLEINNVYSSKYNGHVSDATWVPDDFFTSKPETWKCQTQ